MKSILPSPAHIRFLLTTAALFAIAASALAQNLVTNGNFSNGLSDWTTNNFGQAPGQFGINANGPTDTTAASGNYAYAGGSTFNLLQQNVTVTTGSAYRLTFLAGSKSGQGNANGVLSLRQEALSNYNSASFDYQPSDAVFGSYTVDFVADTTTIGVWLRSDNSYAAYDSVSVTEIASVENAMNYSSASGYSQISSALTGSGKVTVNAGTGGLTLSGANTHTGGTEVIGGTLFVAGDGTLGATDGSVTVSGGGILDLRNQQIRTGTISMNNQDARIISGDVNNPGSIVNNGGAFQLGGGLLAVPLSGTGGMDVTGGGGISSSNSYTGATTISGTTGWYGTGQLFVNNANALGAASSDLSISGGYVNLQSNTITRSGGVILSGGTIANGTLSKGGGDFDLQGGTVDASLAGTAGLIKSTTDGASLNASNSYTGGTTISGGTLFVGGSGTLGDASGDVTVSGTGSDSTLVVLELRSQQTRTGTITMTNQDARILNGGGGSIVNNGAFRFGGGLLDVDVSGTGGLNVTGGGRIDSSNSYTGATTISGTAGWYGTEQLFVNNTNALGAASGDLTISGGRVNLQTNTITRSGNVTISGGTLTTGTLNKTGGVFALQGGDGSIAVTLAGTAGLTKSGAGTSYLWLSNSYTGATAISEGTLVTDSEGQLTAGTTLAISNGATWQMTGANSTTNGATRTIGGLSGDGTVQTTTSGLTHNLAVNKASGSDTFSGVIAGSGALVKQGAGTLVLGGVNTYTGNTVVSEGSLQLASTGVLRFLIGGNGVNNDLSGPGTSVLAGQFVFDLSGAATATNATWTIVANTLANSYGTNFVVSGFNGVSGGNWTNTTNGVSYVFSQSNGVLSVQTAASPSPYNSWVSYWQSLYPSFTNSGGTDDPDGDLFDNNEEFAFDGNPMIGTGALLTVTRVGANAIFNYVALTNTNSATYVVQNTTNLSTGPWTNSSVTISDSINQTNPVISQTNLYKRKEFVVPATNNKFYRVQATIPP
jgi:autotransporter-associated beta strand protein